MQTAVTFDFGIQAAFTHGVEKKEGAMTVRSTKTCL
jgi:hypothetical protein